MCIRDRLDTQDFYEGLLNDIQPSLLGYYLQTPFISKELLLNLLVERIVVHVTDGACAQSHLTTCERNLRNNPYTPEDIALFQTFVTIPADLAGFRRASQSQGETLDHDDHSRRKHDCQCHQRNCGGLG